MDSPATLRQVQMWALLVLASTSDGVWVLGWLLAALVTCWMPSREPRKAGP